MTEQSTYINQWEKVFEQHLFTISKFVKSQVDTHLSYARSHKNRSELGFNAFTMASDTYYRENYHSYILKALLDPLEKHMEGNAYLNCFIETINYCNKVPRIELSAFANAEVFREWHDIDILIKDDISKKAIIIENKIYNADDQPRQLPRYYHLIKQSHDVLAIVYLPLDISKKPSKKDWTKEEMVAIDNLLCIIPSYHSDANITNLYTHWIKPSKKHTTVPDNSFILKHYGNLIKYLNTNTMDTISLSKFYGSLLEENNHDTALSIKNMLNDLPEYLAIRIVDRYKDSYAPFTSIGPYQKRDAVFEAFKYNDRNYKIDVWCDEKGYNVHFRETTNNSTDMKELFKHHIPQLKSFTNHNQLKSYLTKYYTIHQEDDLFTLIDTILNKLLELKESNNQ